MPGAKGKRRRPNRVPLKSANRSPKGAERPEAEIPGHELPELIESLRREMKAAADALEFERAGDLRDRIRDLEQERLRIS